MRYKNIFLKKNKSYIFLNLDHKKKFKCTCVNYLEKIKMNQIFMNQNQKSLFKANFHVIIQWLTWMKRNFEEKINSISIIIY